MRIHHFVDAALVADPHRRGRTLKMLRDLGVGTVWLYGYFFGRFWSDIGTTVHAKEILESEGFEAGAVNLAVGHPGNALNPEDDTIDLRIPPHWRYRVDRRGEPVHFCGDVEDAMIRDNAAAVKTLADAGFTQVFLDDDFRQGNYGPEIQGCFCDDCIATFNRARGEAVSRADLDRRIQAGQPFDPILMEWAAFNCAKTDRLLRAMTDPRVRLGVMVMKGGDERHGIDIASMRAIAPDAMFRVGELMFDDRSFEQPKSKAREYAGILMHMDLTGREAAHSETTVFPPRALSPDNLVRKAMLAIMAGVPNLCLMTGVWVPDPDYVRFWKDALPAMRALEESAKGLDRAFPVHVAAGVDGTCGEPSEPDATPALAGLPSKPVRLAGAGKPGRILLFTGSYRATPEWIGRMKEYDRVVFDAASALRNADAIRALPEEKTVVLARDRDVAALREALRGEDWDFPYAEEGDGAILAWIPGASRAILFNPAGTEARLSLRFGGRSIPVALEPHEFRTLDL